LMPACDKHFHDSSITPRRWENARKRREAAIKEMMGKKCYFCGRPATGWVDMNLEPAFDKYGNDIPSDYVPKWAPICGEGGHRQQILDKRVSQQAPYITGHIGPKKTLSFRLLPGDHYTENIFPDPPAL
jgi:hypothetical protein